MIIIPGMDMPETCLDCTFCDSLPDGEFDCIVFIEINGYPLIVTKNRDKRDKQCPLKEGLK